MTVEERARRTALAVALVAIAAAILLIEAPWQEGSTIPGDLAGDPSDPPAPTFGGAKGWIGDPVDLAEERGSPVLVDFWTYSCRNCINTFPYLRAWHEAYDDRGLTMVGVHTPEFGFERDPANVRDAVERYDLNWSHALDNGYEIWDAYGTRFWPTKVLVGPDGRIRHTHAGEGAYAETEGRIRNLLREAGRDPGPPANVSADAGGLAIAQTPELFAAPVKGEGAHAIGNEEGYQRGRNVTYAIPEDPPVDRIHLSGTWWNREDHLVATSGNASVRVNFTAGGANVVAGGPNGTCVPVGLDGEAIPPDRDGPDITYGQDRPPCFELNLTRAYDLYSGPFDGHVLELDVPEGFELYSFAFSAKGRE